MNSDVKGTAKVANFVDVMEKDPSYFLQFNLIITANIPLYDLFPLAQLCWNASVPINLMVLRSYGFIGSVRLQIRDHNIIESKSDNDPFDLRISNPFPELKEYCESYAILLNEKTNVDTLQHSHIPYIVILYEAIKKWKSNHNNNSPSNFKEKEQFKQLIKDMAINYNDELNFQEAVRESYRAYTPKVLSPEVNQTIHKVYNSKEAFSSSTSEFEFLCYALVMFLLDKDFNPDQLPPLPGQVPDLTATTDLYIQLQKVYKDKSEADVQHFKKLLNKLLIANNRSENSISDEIVSIFCKHSYSLISITSRSIEQEISSDIAIDKVKDILESELFDDPVQTPILWYLTLRAVDRFYSKHNRWPGDNDITLESDQNQIYSELNSISKEYDIIDLVSGDSTLLSTSHAVEITRYGGSELHNISALIGGIAAQEAVKLITKQYVPLNNTYLFNGIASVGATYDL